MDYEICYNEKLGEYGPDSKEIEHKIMGKEKVGGSWIRLEPVSLTLALDFCDDAHLHKSQFSAVIIEFEFTSDEYERRLVEQMYL